MPVRELWPLPRVDCEIHSPAPSVGDNDFEVLFYQPVTARLDTDPKADFFIYVHCRNATGAAKFKKADFSGDARSVVHLLLDKLRNSTDSVLDLLGIDPDNPKLNYLIVKTNPLNEKKSNDSKINNYKEVLNETLKSFVEYRKQPRPKPDEFPRILNSTRIKNAVVKLKRCSDV
jgi:hypothetical protein